MRMFTQSWLPEERCEACEEILETQESYDHEDNLIEVCSSCGHFVGYL